MTAATAPLPAAEEPKKGGFSLPSAYTILFVLIVIVAALTYVIPAGLYDTDPNGEPIPGTYHQVDPNPQRILVDSLMAPINGLYGIESAEDGSVSVWNSGELFGAIDVALFILVIGGFLAVTMKTGAIQNGIARIVSRMRGREKWLIPILMAVFALGGTTYGMAEESLAFYVLIITVMIAAGYDALVGASILLLGCGIGVLGSTINPFATGIASEFAGTTLAEGLIGRLVLLIVGTAIGIWFVMRYAAKVKADPTKSLVYDMKESNEKQFHAAEDEEGAQAPLTGSQKAVLVLFFLAFVVMIYGVIPWEDLGIGLPTLWWWFPEMTASFLFFGILIGIVGRMKETDFTSTFVDGARDLLGVALIIGIARGITVIMTNGLITDTVLNAAEQLVSDVGGAVFINLMYLLFLPLSFLIPSSSGLATVAMPIMAPLATLRGRATAARRDRVPERQWPAQPDNAHVGSGDGRPGHRACRLRNVAQIRVAGAPPAGHSHDRRSDCFSFRPVTCVARAVENRIGEGSGRGSDPDSRDCADSVDCLARTDARGGAGKAEGDARGRSERGRGPATAG